MSVDDRTTEELTIKGGIEAALIAENEEHIVKYKTQHARLDPYIMV